MACPLICAIFTNEIEMVMMCIEFNLVWMQYLLWEQNTLVYHEQRFK